MAQAQVGFAPFLLGGRKIRGEDAGVIEKSREEEAQWRYLLLLARPPEPLGGRLTIHLYPFGSWKGSKRRFEKYREGGGAVAV